VKENSDFKLLYAIVKNSLGIGVTVYDTTGHVSIDSVTFEKNGPSSLNCQSWKSMENVRKLDNVITAKAIAGGGLCIEFTYNETHGNSRKNSRYHILQSIFKGNIAPYSELENTTFRHPGGVRHIGFGRGGGLSVYIRGSAEKNSFVIDSCIFEDNQAIWGGGYFIQFLDSAHGNNIKVSNTNVNRNMACFGGGAFQLSIISSINKSDSTFIPNNMLSKSCWFTNNSAASGGGGTINGRTSLGYIDNSYYFNNCTWMANEATTGFALTLKLSDYDQGLFGPNSPFKVKLSDCHIVANTMRDVSRYGWGVGTVYDFLVPLFLTNVHFIANTNTSLILDTSSVQVYEKVTFTRNTGYKGGAVAMYGEASFHLMKGSRLIFDGNIASENGGAIFVETPGPDSIPFVRNNYLQTHECFFKYEDSTIPPDEWQTQVIFIGNEAPLATGYSIYTNSLRDCIHPNEDIATALEWKTFHYYLGNASNSTLKRKFEIVTDAVKIHSRKSDWSVPPAQFFSPHVTLLDEKNNSVYGIVNVNIRTDDSSPVTLGRPYSLYLVRNKIPSLDLRGKSGTNFSVEVRTVGGQFAQKILENVELKKCDPGFVLHGTQCVCASVNRVRGVSRCNEENSVVYLEKGYWAGEVENDDGETVFVTAQCPAEYCNCLKPDHLSLREDECVYNQDEICKGDREGVMCGSCTYGTSVQVGFQSCSAGCSNSQLWRLIPLLVCLTVLVFIIFTINRDVFTCYLNVWLLFYQVVQLVVGVHQDITFDPFIWFVIGLAEITINGFGGCLWEGMDNLQKLGFSYLLPVYVFVVVFIISLVSRKFPDSYFTRRSTFRASCTLFVLCYSTLARVSMDILRPSLVGDKLVVFYQGTVAYFSSYHCYFAVPALLILLFIVIPFPLILMFPPFCTKCRPVLRYTNPLFSTFQSCFKDRYKWYAGFYFLCRFFFLLFAIFIPHGTVKALFMQISCLIVITIHVRLWPYLENYNLFNLVDAVLLTTLAIISIIAGQITNSISENAKDKMVILVDVLAYIPLVYLLGLALYLFFSCILPKRRGPPNEQSLQNLGNDDHPDPEIII
jgi:predicted outer membrane repeat protein